jgi:hypothetical protein
MAARSTTSPVSGRSAFSVDQRTFTALAHGTQAMNEERHHGHGTDCNHEIDSGAECSADRFPTGSEPIPDRSEQGDPSGDAARS